MAHWLLPVLLALLVSTSGFSQAQTFCCQIGESGAVADLTGGKLTPRKLTAGSDPSISPDGKRIAFTRSDAEGNRFIAVADVESGKWKPVAGIPGKNSYMPIWSPDGSTLTFNYFLGDNWAVASVDAGGGHFKMLDNLPRQPGPYGWFPNGKELLCQNMESFFVLKFDAGGDAVLKEIPKSPKLTGLSTPSRIAVSPDGQSALFDMFLDGETGSGDGPPSAVFLLDIASGKTSRLTPKGYDAISPCWLPDGKEFLLSALGPKSSRPSIYRAALDSSAPPVAVLKSASYPSLPVAEPRHEPAGKEFEAFRSEWNAKAKRGDWKLVKRDLPVKEKGRKEFVGGWLEGNVLQRLVHVDTRGEGNESITLYFWRDGQLTSVFQLRKGTMTEISEVNEATETYNFVDGKLAGWHRTGDADSDVDPGDPIFQDAGKQVLKESIKLAEPIYLAIGAD